jgi:hypothetical protein
MKYGRILGALALLSATSCAESSNTVTVDAEWNLTCPAGNEVGCGALAPETCLNDSEDGFFSPGWRSILGARGESSCTGEPIVAGCEAVERSSGMRVVFLEASVGGDFAFELTGATVDPGDGSMQQTACNVTVVEDGLPYDVGACGEDPPSMEQPCQLSNISTEGGEVVFDLECDALLSSVTGNGFDLGAVGGGPTTIRFNNCDGF